MSDSDDKRAYVYANFKTTHGQVEVQVQGAEGETVGDIEHEFDKKLDRVVSKQQQLEQDTDEKRGVE